MEEERKHAIFMKDDKSYSSWGKEWMQKQLRLKIHEMPEYWKTNVIPVVKPL